MAKFELSIYGTDDEVIKKYETNHIRWGVLLKAVNIAEELKGKNDLDQFKYINEFMKSIFTGITDEELEKADSQDIINTFKQLLSSVNSINAGDSKNA